MLAGIHLCGVIVDPLKFSQLNSFPILRFTVAVCIQMVKIALFERKILN